MYRYCTVSNDRKKIVLLHHYINHYQIKNKFVYVYYALFDVWLLESISEYLWSSLITLHFQK